VVSHLNDATTVLRKYTLSNAWPTNVSDIAVSNDSRDTLEEFTVSFQYTSMVTTTK
jgi:hypothetical protein